MQYHHCSYCVRRVGEIVHARACSCYFVSRGGEIGNDLVRVRVQ